MFGWFAALASHPNGAGERCYPSRRVIRRDELHQAEPPRRSAPRMRRRVCRPARRNRRRRWIFLLNLRVGIIATIGGVRIADLLSGLTLIHHERGARGTHPQPGSGTGRQRRHGQRLPPRHCRHRNAGMDPGAIGAIARPVRHHVPIRCPDHTAGVGTRAGSPPRRHGHRADPGCQRSGVTEPRALPTGHIGGRQVRDQPDTLCYPRNAAPVRAADLSSAAG